MNWSSNIWSLSDSTGNAKLFTRNILFWQFKTFKINKYHNNTSKTTFAKGVCTLRQVRVNFSEVFDVQSFCNFMCWTFSPKFAQPSTNLQIMLHLKPNKSMFQNHMFTLRCKWQYSIVCSWYHFPNPNLLCLVWLMARKWAKLLKSHKIAKRVTSMDVYYLHLKEWAKLLFLMTPL